MIAWLPLAVEVGALVGFLAGVAAARPRRPSGYSGGYPATDMPPPPSTPSATMHPERPSYTARCCRCDWARLGFDRDVLEQQLIEHHHNHHREPSA